jgi:membrane protein
LNIKESKIAEKAQKLWIKVALRLRHTELPGFRGMSLYDVLKFFIQGLSDTKFSLMAAAMAFNFFFSFFPTLLLLVLFISWLPDAGLDNYITSFLEGVLPPQTLKLVDLDKLIDVQHVRSVIKNTVDPSRNTSIFFIGLILFFALRGALKGIIAMTLAFTKDEEVFRKRNIFQTYSIALIIFFVLGGLFLFSVGVLIAGKWLVYYLQIQDLISPGFQTFFLTSFNYIITLALLIFSVSSVYYLAPATHQRWKFFTPGAFLASFLILITVIGFSWFFSNLTNFQTVYGSLAAIILFMLWFYYLSMVLLIGFELNAAIDLASYHQEQKMACRKENAIKVGEKELAAEENATSEAGDSSREPSPNDSEAEAPILFAVEVEQKQES